MSDRQNGDASDEPAPAWPISQTPGAAWPPPPTQEGPPIYFGPIYASPASSARWAIGFLIAYAVLDIITAAFELMQTRNVTNVELEIITAGLDMIQFLISIAAAVFFLMWVYRVATNALALVQREMPINPGWAVGYFFIPILGFFRPYQAMRDIWRASEPGLNHSDPKSWLRGQTTPLIGWWWAYWLAFNLVELAFVILSLFPSVGYNARQGGVPTLLDIVHVGLALVAMRLVGLLSVRQDEAYRRLISAAGDR